MTDLGLCKKIGDVNPEDDPEVVLARMRGQAGDEGSDIFGGAGIASNAEGSGSKHRQKGDDVMAMSIDGIPTTNDPQKPKYESAKARREVRRNRL